jgi:hypothetical protein
LIFKGYGFFYWFEMNKKSISLKKIHIPVSLSKLCTLSLQHRLNIHDNLTILLQTANTLFF